VDREHDELLTELIRRGRAAWPEIDLPEPLVAGHLSDQIGAGEPGAGASLHAEDLYLACACAIGIEAAIAAFEARYLGQVKVFLGRMKPTPALIDDVKQALRVRLLVAPPGEVPRIAEYAGRGSLSSWLRVAAIRLAIDALTESGATRPPPDDESGPMFDQLRGDDAELELVKEQHLGEVNQALREAFGALSAEQRNLLRLSYRDGRSIDEIGARRRLEARLRLTPAELQSLIRLLRSQLHLSVSRLLRT
jgi:RNA polymerase sigma-70 factor (ECF subfamily)